MRLNLIELGFCVLQHGMHWRHRGSRMADPLQQAAFDTVVWWEYERWVAYAKKNPKAGIHKPE